MRNETLLNEGQTGEFLTIGVRALQTWRVAGKGPRFLKIGRLIRYRKSDLEAWIERQVRQSTSDTGEAQ